MGIRMKLDEVQSLQLCAKLYAEIETLQKRLAEQRENGRLLVQPPPFGASRQYWAAQAKETLNEIRAIEWRIRKIAGGQK